MADVLERVVLLQHSEAHQKLTRELDVVASATAGISEVRQISPGCEFASRSRSRCEVGGDLCEVVALNATQSLCVLGDGSGDSIPAAMIMTAARGALHALIEAAGDQPLVPAAMAEVINRSLLRVTAAQQFFSAIIGILDRDRRSFTFTNAGHPPGLLIHGRDVRALESHGLLLGVVDCAVYSQVTVPVEPGDLLILFSDGITEARDAGRQQFEQNGILAAISQRTFHSAGDALEAIWERFESHTGGIGMDDRTLLVIRVTG